MFATDGYFQNVKMPKAKAKTKHLTDCEILDVLAIPLSDDSDDDLPPVEVDPDFVPDIPVDVEEEVIYEVCS